ncbi:MAG: D-alanyl-D-alanine carboxypeptidase [Desulfobacterales bacterium]|nr:D-alanyl-D-alanine carboxypeptidase [Desulfobacterales bacterium]
MNRKKSLIGIVVFLIFSAPANFSFAQAENDNIGFLLADKYGKALISNNANKPLIPASIFKIVTALAAISYLGENYKYQTHFYYNKLTSDLSIKGFGDPLFISEEIKKASKLLALKLKKEKILVLNNIILDHSFFEDNINIPGRGDTLNPYDAYQSALCANFNTVFFKTDTTNNEIISAEKQTPMLPIFEKKIIATGLKNGRITLSKKESLSYPGSLVKYFLKEDGINISGQILYRTTLKNEGPFLIYNSEKKLLGIIQNLLKYSNNFMANQLLLTMGAHVSGAPSNLKKSISAINAYLSANFQNLQIKYDEGSGISRKNQISSENMVKILIQFMPYHNLLRKDDKGFYKTGTLSGIKTRAGYIRGKNKSLYPYVIMINEKNKGYNDILKQMGKKVENL